jgi:hypothetical protein
LDGLVDEVVVTASAAAAAAASAGASVSTSGTVVLDIGEEKFRVGSVTASIGKDDGGESPIMASSIVDIV